MSGNTASDSDQLRQIAEQLGNVPREATESWQDMFHFLRRTGGRIRVIADRVEARGETKARILRRSWQAPPLAPAKPVRAVPCRRRPPGHAGDPRQVEMVV